jgi:hypothetical protein
MLCQYCSHSEFRRSRLHREDLPHLLALKLPVRCRNCRHRVYANIFYARLLPAPKEKLAKPSAALGPTDA